MLAMLVGFRLCAAVHGYLLRYGPTNVGARYLRSARGVKWATPAALVLVPAYLGAAYACTTALERGAPGALHLLVLLFVWNAAKFGWLEVLAYCSFVARLMKTTSPRLRRIPDPPST